MNNKQMILVMDNAMEESVIGNLHGKNPEIKRKTKRIPYRKPKV